jgi:hypothetical protein
MIRLKNQKSKRPKKNQSPDPFIKGKPSISESPYEKHPLRMFFSFMTLPHFYQHLPDKAEKLTPLIRSILQDVLQEQLRE